MRIRQFTPREKRLGAALVTALLFYALYALLVGPMAARWRELSNSIQTTESALKKNLAIVHRRNIIEDRFAKLTAHRSSRQTAKDSDVENWLEAVEEAAGTNVWLEHISPRPEQRTASYLTESAEIECRGKLVDIARFLHELINSSNLIRVDHLRIRALGSGPDELRCTMLISRVTVN